MVAAHVASHPNPWDDSNPFATALAALSAANGTHTGQFSLEVNLGDDERLRLPAGTVDVPVAPWSDDVIDALADRYNMLGQSFTQLNGSMLVRTSGCTAPIVTVSTLRSERGFGDADDTKRTLSDGASVDIGDAEVVWALCPSSPVKFNVHVRIVRNETIVEAAQSRTARLAAAADAAKVEMPARRPSVLMLVYESISRPEFLRMFPLTISVLESLNGGSSLADGEQRRTDAAREARDKQNLRLRPPLFAGPAVFDFARYHAIASNSLPNKMGLYAGSCWEKSCAYPWARSNSSFVDHLFLESGAHWENPEPNFGESQHQRWLWRWFQSRGYITGHGEEVRTANSRDGASFSAHSAMTLFDVIPSVGSTVTVPTDGPLPTPDGTTSRDGWADEGMVSVMFPAEVYKQAASPIFGGLPKGPRVTRPGGPRGPPPGHTCGATSRCLVESVAVAAAHMALPCAGQRSCFNLTGDWLRDLWDRYSADNPIFATFQPNMAYQGQNAAEQCQDLALARFLVRLRDEGHLEHTLVILTADHGVKWGPKYKHRRGKLENKLPLMTMIVPPLLRTLRPGLTEHLARLTTRLLTPRDIHWTLQLLAQHPLPPTEVQPPFVTDIFDVNEPPRDRTCADAAVPFVVCLDLVWRSLDMEAEESVVSLLVEYAMSRANEFVEFGEGPMCESLHLDKPLSVELAEQVNEEGTLVYSVRLQIVAPHRLASEPMILKAFVTVDSAGTMWMHPWDLVQESAWSKYTKCDPSLLRPPIEGQFCICKAAAAPRGPPLY
jgi:hypothetical protein